MKIRRSKNRTSLLAVTGAVLCAAILVAGCNSSNDLTSGGSSNQSTSGANRGVSFDGNSFVEGPAPDIALQTLDGKTLNLSQMKGQVVMVDIWAPWCAPCRLGLPFTQRLYKTFKNKGLEVVTLTSDPKTEVSEFMKSEGYTFPVMMDTQQKLSTAFSVQGLPTTVIIDKNGNVIGKEMGLNTQAATIAELKKAGLEMGNFAPKDDPTDNSIPDN